MSRVGKGASGGILGQNFRAFGIGAKCGGFFQKEVKKLYIICCAYLHCSERKCYNMSRAMENVGRDFFARHSERKVMTMKLRARILSALMAAALSAGILFPTGPEALAASRPDQQTAAAPAALGEIQAILRLDYAQPLEALKNHDVKVGIARNDVILEEVRLWEPGIRKIQTSDVDAQVQVEAKNADGEEDATGWPKYLTLTVSGLPKGEYTLGFTGLGYRSYFQKLDLSQYSQHVTLGTGDSTFTLGDVNGDGQVNAADRDMLSRQLASKDQTLLPTYDFNGDGAIDVVDLAYLNCNIEAEGGAQLAEGAMLNPPVDLEAMAQAGLTVTAGSLENLFSSGEEGVTLSAPGATLQLPIPFSTPVEMSQMTIVTPEVGGIESGTVTVEYADGETEEHLIETVLPAGLFAISRTPGSRTITISLGKRVAVKKITVTVTKTETGTVAMQSVQFLKDIIPENPADVNRVVSGLAATAGSESAELKWRGLPNVTGYQITYWMDGSSAKRTMRVNVPYATVSGLENLKKYWFQVTPVAEGWEGDPCDAVSATPQPAQRPDAPDMVSVQELDGALNVSWKKSAGATYYEVYYKEKDSSEEYRQTGGMLLSTGLRIPNLKNGVTYLIYVIAGNNVGSSKPSRTSEGTPKAVDYTAPEGLPKAGLLDRSKIEQIRLAWPTNYAPGEYTEAAPFTPNNMIDGDYRTHWTAKNWSGNEHVICTFKEPVDLQAVLWVPRLDGNYPRYLRAYSVQVWYEGDDLSKNGRLIVPDPAKGGQDNNGGTGGGDVFTWPDIPNRNAIPTSKFGILPFGPAKKIVQISVAVEQAEYNLVNCSELLFMEYDPSRSLPDEISALFANDLRTQLKPGVTEKQIADLKARLNSDERYYYLDTAALADELELAGELLKGSSSGVVIEGVQARSGGVDSTNYAQSGSELQPLGAASQAGKEITVYAGGIPEGGKLTLYASQFNAEASTWRASMGDVKNGRNTFTVPKIGSQNTQRGGSLYFTYTGPNPDQVKLHVRRATDIPVLELSGWYAMTEAAKVNTIQGYLDELDAYLVKAGVTQSNRTTNCLNVTEISTPTMLLSLPALAVKNSTTATGDARVQALFNSVLAWEDVMHICKTTQGIDKTYGENDMQTRQNIRCMQMFSGAFMYAAGNHIGIGYNSCAGMAGGQPISVTGQGAANRLFGWGIAHEIGHNMDKLGRAEITNNIYALMVQTYDGQANTLPSRLENSGKYAEIFDKTAQGLPGESNNVFVQLGMYWQLHLAYDNAAQPMDFYNRFFKAWKSGTYTQGFSGLSYNEKVALTASGVVEKDLTEFFTRWGMRLGDSVKAKLETYAQEPRALWYLSDQSRRDRLAGKTTARAGFSAAAGKKSGSNNEIDITITPPNVENVQGYEILRDGRAIAFVQHKAGEPPVYTDVIGSGNHLAFTYQVRAYSTLGEIIGTAEAGQVRVAYDKTVPASQYELKLDGTTATFTLNEETPVSGLKLVSTTPDASAALTVEITDGASKTVTARQGTYGESLSGDDPDSYATYFNKPGENTAGGTIWTYDAKTVTVTGLPEGIERGNVQLIEYAGDDVSFLSGEDGFAGRLSADYDCGGGNVLKAGTLVVVGTYRGDPYYGSVIVKGKFTTTKVTVDENGKETVATGEEIREMAGDIYTFAEVPEDQKVSDISNGLFLFVPNVQQEAELQDATHCDGVNLLPSQIMAEMYRADDPNNPNGSKRLTASTLWMNSPGGEDLPQIVLESD